MAAIQSKIDRFALLEWLINVKRDEVWEYIAKLKKEVGDNPAIISDAEYNSSIRRAIQQADNGDVISHEEVVSISSNW
jgi:hypothetical protein